MVPGVSSGQQIAKVNRMAEFKFRHSIQVRYSDIDAQHHVNNTRYSTYIESARLAYLKNLKLWDGKSFLNLGITVADVHIAYRKPIYLGQTVIVATRISRLGNKSIQFEYQIQEAESAEICATAETINVAYDFHTEQSIAIPKEWRKVISAYEGFD